MAINQRPGSPCHQLIQKTLFILGQFRMTFSILRHPLGKKLIAMPLAWPGAISILLAKWSGRKSAVVRREGFLITVGTRRGQGSWCALAGSAYEPELPWLLDRLSEGGVFIDVGSNIGLFAMHAARKVGSNGKVIAIEPGAGAFSLLEMNIRQNNLARQSVLLNAAVSGTPGKMRLSGDSDSWNSLSISKASEDQGQLVDVTTIDKIADDHQLAGVDVIKIDAEGVEGLILSGAANAIQNFHPAIIFEKIYSSGSNNPEVILKAAGYTVFSLSAESPNRVALHADKMTSNQNLMSI